MRRSVGDLAVIALEAPAPEHLLRWVRELHSAPPGVPADITWHREAAGSLAATPLPHASRDARGAWQCAGEGHHVPAMLQDVLIGRSATLLHACGLAFAGSGVVLVGSTGAGKTLAATAATTDPRIRLLSDDLVVAERSGRVHAYPTPVALRPYHRALLPEAMQSEQRRHARHSALLGALVRLPGARSLGRAARARLGRRSDGVGDWSRLVKTDYLAVPTDRLIPAGERLSETTARLVVMLRADGPPHVGDIGVQEAAEAALAATYENDDMAGAVERYGGAGHLDVGRHRQEAAEIIAGFLRSAARLVQFRGPRTADPADAQRYLIDTIEAHMR